MKTENLIYKMLTENTGTALCDSGGAYGRNWQLNAKKSHADFENEPQAVLNIEHNYFDITLSLYHHLVKTLNQDDFCKRFNKLACNDWNGDYYGTSRSQCDWLEKNDFYIDKDRCEFNSYNWSSNFSQVVQGTFLKQAGYVDNYVLLQIHGGCDVRGGYTDAKLFKVDSDYFLYESACFSINENYSLDVMGEDISLYNYETENTEYITEPDAIKQLSNETQFIGSMTY